MRLDVVILMLLVIGGEFSIRSCCVLFVLFVDCFGFVFGFLFKIPFTHCNCYSYHM